MIENPLSILIDRDLSSVEFVRDYIQFRFDGLTLSVYTDPELMIDGNSIKWGSQQFCVEVVRCINQVVVKAEIKESDAIRIQFKNGTLLIVSLKPEDYQTAEAAWLIDSVDPGISWVW